jgi:hypothetical protein
MEKKEKYADLSPEAKQVLAKFYGDPLIEQIPWAMVKENCNAMGTHKLQPVGPERAGFVSVGLLRKWGIRLWMFTAVLFLVGVALKFGVGGRKGWEFFHMFNGFSVGMFITGLILFLLPQRQRTFCKKIGLYWVGSKEPNPDDGVFSSKTTVYLKDIRAIQIPRPKVQTKRYAAMVTGLLGPFIAYMIIAAREKDRDPSLDAGSGWQYELCLVMNDGRRIRVLSCLDHKVFLKEVYSLAKFLQLPVWDYRRLNAIQAKAEAS